jgi:hypothetical protein
MRLLSFSKFINEGVYLGKDDLAYLSYIDDPTNPNEVLKTGDSGVTFFNNLPVKNKLSGSPWNWKWPIFWALGPDGSDPNIDHPGRIKYTMDKLKKSEIANLDSSLFEFIKKSFVSLGINSNFKPDYIVTVGSTAGLVKKMANTMQKVIGPEIKVLDLPKVVYLNALDAFDWREVNDQVNRLGLATFKKVKQTIYNYVDVDKTPDTLKQGIKSATTIEELKNTLYREGIILKDIVARENVQPFIVRSSGRTSGGSRSFWKNKYDFSTQSFIDAVIDCAINGKRMLIIDDNRHTGIDNQNIRDNIEEIVAGLDSNKTDGASNRFGFFVLYRIPKTKKYLDSKGNSKDIATDSATVLDFETYMKNKLNLEYAPSKNIQ